MTRWLILGLLLPLQAFAGPIWYRVHDADSVVIGPVCVPELAGEEFYGALDFNTASLTITIYASGNGVDTSYSYTGGNIDDYDGTPPAWGNPTTSAIEVEADDDCIRLHIRDEVFAVTGATEWSINISDGGTLLMDWQGQVLALSDSADNRADIQAELEEQGLDHLLAQSVTGSDIANGSIVAELASKSATSDWDSYDNETDSLEASQDDITTIDNELATAQSDLDDLTGGIILKSSTCDSGSTTTCVDATLIEADNYWKGVAIVFTSGSVVGQSSCVFSFTASSDTLTFRARTAAVSTNNYILVSHPTCEGVVSP